MAVNGLFGESRYLFYAFGSVWLGEVRSSSGLVPCCKGEKAGKGNMPRCRGMERQLAIGLGLGWSGYHVACDKTIGFALATGREARTPKDGDRCDKDGLRPLGGRV
jgi:hypothetical protein